MTRDIRSKTFGYRRCRRKQAGTDHFGAACAAIPSNAGGTGPALSDGDAVDLTLIPAWVIILHIHEMRAMRGAAGHGSTVAVANTKGGFPLAGRRRIMEE